MEKVVATEAATKVIQQLQKQHGHLVFIHSEGCCEGTSPLCVPKGEFYLGSRDVKIGEISGVPYYMNKSNQPYWQHMQIVIDVTDTLANSFSLESQYDKSFIIRSRKLER